MLIRSAQNDDANGIAGVLHDLVTAGKRNKPADADFAFHHYIAHPGKIACHGHSASTLLKTELASMSVFAPLAGRTSDTSLP